MTAPIDGAVLFESSYCDEAAVFEVNVKRLVRRHILLKDW